MSSTDWLLAWLLVMWLHNGLARVASAIRYHRDGKKDDA